MKYLRSKLLFVLVFSLLMSRLVFAESTLFIIEKVSRNELSYSRMGKLHQFKGEMNVNYFYQPEKLPESEQGEVFVVRWKSLEQVPVNSTVTIAFDLRRENNLVLETKSIEETLEKNGTHISQFSNIGEEFLQKGKIATWKVSIIYNGEIVAQKISAQWSDSL